MPPAALMSSAPSRAGMRAGAVRSKSGPAGRGVQARASSAAAAGVFSPWTHDANQLPGRVQDYLSLLAESSTTGMMQKHLVKMMAKGAGAALKIGDVAMNPMDSIADCVADAGTDLIMKQINTPSGGWSKLRQAVIGTSMFKAAGKSKDDSYTPPPQIDPMHSKALGVLVSVLMSGAVSGAADAMPLDMPFLNTNHGGVEMSQSVTVQSKFEHAGSMKSAPSFALRGDGGAEMVSSGGMAASTAMKLLRADSKVGDVMPDLKDIFSSALDSIEEECDDGAFDKLMNQMKKAGGGNGFGGGNFNGGSGGNFSGGSGGIRSGPPVA